MGDRDFNDLLWKKCKFGSYNQYCELRRPNGSFEDEEIQIKVANQELKALQNKYQPENVIATQFTDFTNVHLKPHKSLTRTIGRDRGIYSADNLKFGEEIFRAVPFAAVAKYQPNVKYCLTCHQTQSSHFRICLKCHSVYFCSVHCQNANATHKLECGSGYQYIEDLDVKCTIQMVLEAISCFQTFDALRTYVESLIVKKNLRIEVPVRVNDKKTKLECIMRLNIGEMFANECIRADKAYCYLINMLEIQKMCYLKGQQRFLRHLVRNFYQVESMYGFQSALQHTEPEIYLKSRCVYDTISFLNHSCVPNTNFKLHGNIMIGTTLRHILPYEELTISFVETISLQTAKEISLGFKEITILKWMNTAERHLELRKFKFICDCALCNISGSNVNVDLMNQIGKCEREALEMKLEHLKQSDFFDNFENCFTLLWYRFRTRQQFSRLSDSIRFFGKDDVVSVSLDTKQAAGSLNNVDGV